jgi:hypothetical protein
MEAAELNYERPSAPIRARELDRNCSRPVAISTSALRRQHAHEGMGPASVYHEDDQAQKALRSKFVARPSFARQAPLPLHKR